MNEQKMESLRVFFWLPFVLIFLTIVGCGPETIATSDTDTTSTPPSTQKHTALSFQEIIDGLDAIVKDFANKSDKENATRIDELKGALATSFPLKGSQPFSLHSLHDQLMKLNRFIKNKRVDDITLAWQNLLNVIDKKSVAYGSYNFSIDTSILHNVLAGSEPQLVTSLRDDFTGFTQAELLVRDSISLESFGSPAFLYSSSSGVSAEIDTGSVIMTDNNKMVAILEFKNRQATIKPMDITKARDLAQTVATLPGYVSSVGRRAAYARFGIGEKLFNEFFAYARRYGITESYLHVREDNFAAINLYQNLGYSKIGEVANYYQQNPPINAHVMRKIF